MSFFPNNNRVYAIINNIPKNFHSNQLRNFFSSFVESCGFICFHYIHREEVQKPLNFFDTDGKSRRVSHCCFVNIVAYRAHELFETYNGQNWVDENGETLPTCCIIKEIKIAGNGESLHKGLRWNCKSIPADRNEFSFKEFYCFPEMHPPFYMPNGNVGTTTDYLLNEIHKCMVPLNVVRKIGKQFLSKQSKELYNNATFDYMSKKCEWKLRKKLKSYNLKSKPFLGASINNGYSHLPCEFSYQEDKGYKEILHPEEGQYEALHYNVDGQERFFEGKVGFKWNNGGYNLIPYPNAQHWNTQQGYFNAQTSDNWNIDPRFYRVPGVDNDKNMRDIVEKKSDKICENYTEPQVDKRFEFAGFEKYTKGIGSKILETLGWKKGQGIGKNGDGIAEPLPNEGQEPSNKKGLGYQRPPKEKRRNKRSNDPPESVLASSSCSKLKFQKEFLKGTT